MSSEELARLCLSCVPAAAVYGRPQYLAYHFSVPHLVMSTAAFALKTTNKTDSASGPEASTAMSTAAKIVVMQQEMRRWGVRNVVP